MRIKAFIIQLYSLVFDWMVKRSIMASGFDWEKILQGKYKFYDIEKSIYSQNRNKANSPEVMAKFICDGLAEGDVPDNLKALYHETMYGTDKKVKQRIIKRVYAIGGKVRWIFLYCQVPKI